MEDTFSEDDIETSIMPNLLSAHEKNIIHVETNEGWNIKTLANFLQNNFPHVTFNINGLKKTWTFTEINKENELLVDVKFDDFTKFIYNCPEDNMEIGIVTKKFYSILKPIKKKDTLKFTVPANVNKNNKSILRTEIINNSQARHIDKAMVVGNFEVSTYEIPSDSDYDIKINIDKSEFSDLITQIPQFGQYVIAKAQQNGIIFYAENNDVFAYNSICLGVWEEGSDILYQAKFSTSLIKRLHKCSSFTTSRINIYVKQEKVMKISIKIGIGQVDIYLSEHLD